MDDADYVPRGRGRQQPAEGWNWKLEHTKLTDWRQTSDGTGKEKRGKKKKHDHDDADDPPRQGAGRGKLAVIPAFQGRSCLAPRNPPPSRFHRGVQGQGKWGDCLLEPDLLSKPWKPSVGSKGAPLKGLGKGRSESMGKSKARAAEEELLEDLEELQGLRWDTVVRRGALGPEPPMPSSLGGQLPPAPNQARPAPPNAGGPQSLDDWMNEGDAWCPPEAPPVLPFSMIPPFPMQTETEPNDVPETSLDDAPVPASPSAGASDSFLTLALKPLVDEFPLPRVACHQDQIAPSYRGEIFGPMVIGVHEPLHPSVKAMLEWRLQRMGLELSEDEEECTTNTGPPRPPPTATDQQKDAFAQAPPQIRKLLTEAEQQFSWPAGRKESLLVQLRSQVLDNMEALSDCTEDEWVLLGWAVDDFRDIQAMLSKYEEAAAFEARGNARVFQAAPADMQALLKAAENQFSWPPGKKEKQYVQLKEQWLHSIDALAACTEEDWQVLQWNVQVFRQLRSLMNV